MNPKRKLYRIILAALALLLVGLACGTGYSTSSKIYGQSGNVTVKLKTSEGTNYNSVEINEDWSWDRIDAKVILSVNEGSCQVTLSGEENTALVMNVSAGNPVETYGELVTDGFGELDLNTDCQGAKDLELQIDFTVK
jgi:hypothetical protein